MVTNHAYAAGLSFRQALIAASVPKHSYSFLIRDLAVDLEELKPALIDLVKRRSFQHLPLHGRPADQVLARDALLSQLSGLYRDEILSSLLDFLEGVLGFVDDESEQQWIETASGEGGDAELTEQQHPWPGDNHGMEWSEEEHELYRESYRDGLLNETDDLESTLQPYESPDSGGSDLPIWQHLRMACGQASRLIFSKSQWVSNDWEDPVSNDWEDPDVDWMTGPAATKEGRLHAIEEIRPPSGGRWAAPAGAMEADTMDPKISGHNTINLKTFGYLDDIAGILKVPVGYIIQWCNHNAVNIGNPEEPIDFETANYIHDHYKPSSFRRITKILALTSCFAAIAALIIAAITK